MIIKDKKGSKVHRSVWGEGTTKRATVQQTCVFFNVNPHLGGTSVRAVNGSKTSNRKSERFSQDWIIPYFLFNVHSPVLFCCLCGCEALKMVSQESVFRGSFK